MSATYGNFFASRALDGDLTTEAHSVCGRNVLIRMKLNFNREYCVDTVRIVQNKLDHHRLRMQGTEIYVTSGTAADKCGDLYLSDDLTLEGKNEILPLFSNILAS